MAVQEPGIYRCINEACARTMPRPVNFCPYCGTAQTAAARAQAPVRDDGVAARPAAVAGAEAAAGTSDQPDSATPVNAAPATAAARAPSAVPSAASPSANAFGRSAGAADAAATPGRARGIPWPPKPPAAGQGPGGRHPVRLRWWILALAVLWGVWLVARPSARKTERRIDAAIALAQACQAKPAQDELIALRAAHATPAQLDRLQRGLNEAAGACTRRRQRDKAWNDTGDAVDALLASGSAERARTRLQAFTRRWGEDKATRALQARIDDSRHPLAAPESSSSRSAQSAGRLVDEARADLARGDAAAARDKMDVCLSMVDASDRRCMALKAQAERVLDTR